MVCSSWKLLGLKWSQNGGDPQNCGLALGLEASQNTQKMPQVSNLELKHHQQENAQVGQLRYFLLRTSNPFLHSFEQATPFPSFSGEIESRSREWRLEWNAQNAFHTNTMSRKTMWMDEIHFAPPFRNPGMWIPQRKYQPTLWCQPWLLRWCRIGFRPSTFPPTGAHTSEESKTVG